MESKNKLKKRKRGLSEDFDGHRAAYVKHNKQSRTGCALDKHGMDSGGEIHTSIGQMSGSALSDYVLQRTKHFNENVDLEDYRLPGRLEGKAGTCWRPTLLAYG